ncbi:hypothetical protein A6V36_37430 [Paraburkholderia ginsengiterrae]|uniref:Uncharacterized protein n=1 Tax=Paraburkholderia ginsengiterrae TaxID=1462993 RepID=A0A1A9NFF9_9BURK|nr:hypothetical protein [Paraburkholderia ginsengiterrae]OAJ52234.1 hypothetical protein A6V36_37430 [Paraburkholderia ginsengiterrae]OAJ65722.1 hypothetical protein A6V37_37570 [Paraburkholderia ginsengiterrae]
MKPQTTRNRSGKGQSARPAADANQAAAGGKSTGRTKARRSSTMEKAGKATPVEAPPMRVARSRKEQVKREKVVRDTFTMPRSDYEKIAVLKQRCLDAGVDAKKSELLRAAVLLLASEPAERMLATIAALKPVKTGRPPRSK